MEMLRKFAILAGALIVFTTQSGIAQEGPGARIADLFEVEPLTAEQEARMPPARNLAELIFPAGEIREAIGFAFYGSISASIDEFERTPEDLLRAKFGYPHQPFDLSDEGTRAALEIIDPVWVERDQLQREGIQLMQQSMLERVEPLIREAVAQTYAVEFDETVLRDIEAFFATESGASFARRSYALAHEPRIFVSISSDGHGLFNVTEDLREEMTELDRAMEQLPAARTFDDLTADHRAALSGLTGVSEEAIEASMNQEEESFMDDDEFIEGVQSELETAVAE